MPRMITSAEKTILRKPAQWSKLYLAVAEYQTVYTALLNGVPASTDMVYEITFTDGAGTLADVLPDMTLYIGTTAGAYDLGMCRIRKAPIAGKFYINETSGIKWQAACHLTVVQDYQIWQKPIRIAGNKVTMDVDIAYSDQHANFNPVPILGSHIVAKMTGANKASREVLKYEDIPSPTTGNKPLFAVKLYAGQVRVLKTKNETDIIDLRFTGYVSDGGGIESVSGDGVDNTDPLNPVLIFPTPTEIGAEPQKGADDHYVTDAQLVVINNTSGTNTGDQDLSALALKSNVLELNNTIPFTPDADYEPATKKYVDDNSHRYVLYAKSESTTISISGETTVFEVALPAGFFAAGGYQLRWSVAGLVHVSTSVRNFISRLYVNGVEVVETLLSLTINAAYRYRHEGVMLRSGSDAQVSDFYTTLLYSAPGLRYGGYAATTEDEGAEIVVRFTLQLSGTVTAGWFGGVTVERVGDTQ